MADGATRSFFPKEWDELLVEHFCEVSAPCPRDDDWKAWLRPIQEKWHTIVAGRVNERSRFDLRNSFNAKEPGTSTFVGIKFDKDKGEWQAIIIGDSCLFHINELGKFKSYLMLNSDAFDILPEAFASFEKDNKFDPSFVGGRAKPGDKFILETDALAKWVLQYKEAGKFNFGLDQLLQIESASQFLEFVDSSRVVTDISLANDDVCRMIISVEEDETQASHQVPAECPSVETTRLQSEWPPILLWMMVAVFFGLPVLCYICYKCWLLFFSDRD